MVKEAVALSAGKALDVAIRKGSEMVDAQIAKKVVDTATSVAGRYGLPVAKEVGTRLITNPQAQLALGIGLPILTSINYIARKLGHSNGVGRQLGHYSTTGRRLGIYHRPE